MKQLKYLMAFALGALVLLPSCEDEENKSRFGNKAYLTSSDRTTMMLIEDTPEFDFTLSVATAKPLDEAAEFIFEVDPSLVNTYNEGFYTEMELMPSQYYQIVESTVTVAEGSARSTDFEIKFVDVDQIDREKKYVLPVTFRSRDGKIDLIESNTVHYYLIRAGSIINWAADITQNNFPVSWSGMSGLQEVTYEAWLWLDNLDEGLDANIRTFMGVENVFLVRLGDTFDIGEIMVVKGTSGKYPDEGSRTSFPVRKWTHLAVTHNNENKVRIYLDGELQSDTQASSGTINLNSNFYIGKSYNDNRWWPGMITEARVWTVARTPEEILDNMYEVDPNTPGLAAYWKFNDAEGNTVADHSPNGFNITSANPLTWVSIGLPEEEE